MVIVTIMINSQEEKLWKMYKISLELGRVGNLKVTFGLIVKDSPEAVARMMYRKHSDLIDRFNYGGSEFLRFTPNPFISMRIMRNDENNTEKDLKDSISMNRMMTFEFVKKSEKVIEAFKIPDIFYTENKITKINSEVAAQHVQTVISMIDKSKAIQIYHAVVDDSVTGNPYEGVSMSFYSVDHTVQLTYMEFEYLVHLIKSLDMTLMSMVLINSYIGIESNLADGKNITAPTQLSITQQPNGQSLYSSNKVDMNTVQGLFSIREGVSVTSEVDDEPEPVEIRPEKTEGIDDFDLVK